MRIVMSMKWDGTTLGQYDELRKSVNWEGNTPKGGVFHVAGFSNDTLKITDIWESEDEFNDFAQNRLMPSIAQLGIKGEPQVEMYPVHALFVPDLHRLS